MTNSHRLLILKWIVCVGPRALPCFRTLAIRHKTYCRCLFAMPLLRYPRSGVSDDQSRTPAQKRVGGSCLPHHQRSSYQPKQFPQGLPRLWLMHCVEATQSFNHVSSPRATQKPNHHTEPAYRRRARPDHTGASPHLPNYASPRLMQFFAGFVAIL